MGQTCIRKSISHNTNKQRECHNSREGEKGKEKETHFESKEDFLWVQGIEMERDDVGVMTATFPESDEWKVREIVC